MSVSTVIKTSTGKKFADGYFNNLTCNGTIINPSVITDTTDSSLTQDAIIVGDTAKKVKETAVKIDAQEEMTGLDILNCNEIDTLVINATDGSFSSTVIADTLESNQIYNTGGITSNSGIFDLIRSAEVNISGGSNTLSMKNTLGTFSTIISAPTLTSGRAITIPDSSGTLTLTGVGQNVSFGTVSSTGLTSPTLTSTTSLSLTSASNQNLNFDAQGTGIINLNTVQSFGVAVNTNDTNSLGFAVRNTGRSFIAIGYLAPGGDIQPTIAAMQSSGLAYTNMTLRDKVLISGSGFSHAYLSDCSLGVSGNIKCSSAIKTDFITPQSSTNTITVPNIVGTMAVSGANQNVSFGNITSTTNTLNSLTIPAVSGTIATTADIPSFQKFMAFRVNADTSVAYKSSGPTLTFSTSSGSGVYNVFIQSGFIIRSIAANSMLAGGARIVNVERVSDTNFMLICRTIAEVGTDSAFSGCVYYD